jgi:hypothetical protein
VTGDELRTFTNGPMPLPHPVFTGCGRMAGHYRTALATRV